jgi:ribosomal protein S18 acetylase RimI-like enzyme
MPHIRPYRPGDEAALASICLRTAASGRDATGLLDDDDVWASIFLLPYLEHDPAFASVVEADDGKLGGYIVAAADTHAYETWFAESWWPRFAQRWPEPAKQLTVQELTAQDGLLRYAYGRRAGLNPYAAAYPAHLHIDLLPDVQRQGWGRRLIETLQRQLHEAGITGLHVVPGENNPDAQAFYKRVGFTELAREPGIVVFGTEL